MGISAFFVLLLQDMRKIAVIILLYIIPFPGISQAPKPKSFDAAWFQMFQGGVVFPVMVSNLFTDHLFVSARYSYDIRDVFCLNAGYIIRPNVNGDLKVMPTLGLIADRMTGPAPGLQVNYSSSRWVVTSINLSMFDIKNHKSLNNVYNWNEINYIVKDYFRPGISLFEQYYWEQKKLDHFQGVTIFGKIKSVQYLLYAFNFWDPGKAWFLAGVGYVHCW